MIKILLVITGISFICYALFAKGIQPAEAFIGGFLVTFGVLID